MIWWGKWWGEVMEIIILVGIILGGLAFATEMYADRCLTTARRTVVAVFFALAGFVVGVGAIACFLFHDGILPDDVRLSGWAAFFSFAKAFLTGPALVATPLMLVGLVLRQFPRVVPRT